MILDQDLGYVLLHPMIAGRTSINTEKKQHAKEANSQKYLVFGVENREELLLSR